MGDNSTETKTTDNHNNILYDTSNIISKPVMKRTVTKPEWLNVKTDTSDNILDNIPRPVLRRQGALLYNKNFGHGNNGDSLIDILDKHDKQITPTHK